MTTPSAALVADLGRVPGDLVVLGAGGKMGPTLARLAKRAAPAKRVVAVARFSEPGLRGTLERHGVECIQADLLDRDALARLPQASERRVHGRAQVRLDRRRAPHLGDERPCPGARRRSRSPARGSSPSRPPACIRSFRSRAAARPRTPRPTPPSGEYANSCVGRERMFEHFSQRHGTPGRLIRLSYAIDMRYGVLHDVGAQGVPARADRPRHRPRQRDLAGRRQQPGAARARPLHDAVERAQRQRRRGDEHPRARERRSASASGSRRCSPAASRRRRGW